MTRLNDLLPASFDRVEFYVRAEVLTEGGRRIVLHDYPNSDQRYIEDLGQLPPKFSVTAFVSGPDFLSRADQLERALQSSGRKDLVMPNFGRRKVFALPYRKDASQIAVGEIRFELSFAMGRAVSGPVKAESSVETVYSKGDTLRQKVGTALKNKWFEPSQSENVLTAIYDIKQVVIALESLYTQLSNISDIESTSNIINLNAPTIVRSSDQISDVLINQLWQTVSTGLSGGQGIQQLIDLTSFGSELSLSLADIRSASVVATPASAATQVPLWSETTGGRLIRNSNRMGVVNATRLCALSCAYEQSADASYENDSQLEEIRKSIEDQHERLLYDDTENVSFIQSDPEVRFAMEDLRLAALEVLDQKEQSTFSLTSVTAYAPLSAFVLSYQLYAESFETSDQVTSRAMAIRNLNQSQASDKLINNITVLQT